MEYRRLGRTELRVSLLGVGGGYVMLLEQDVGSRIFQHALDLGMNYFDGRYGHTNAMLRPVIRQDRARCIVATKTGESSKEGALYRIHEDLVELGTDYLDVFYLRVYNHEALQAAMAPGGAVEGVLEAREQGKVRFLGLSGHSDLSALTAGVETGLIDVVLFPLNVVRRDACDRLIPACLKHDVGMAVMKPVNVGLVPPGVCLPWLANQPIHTMAPGVNSSAHLEANAAALERDPMALSPDEEAEVECWRLKMDRATCRICDRVCQAVCEPGIRIDWHLYHNVFQNEIRNDGLEPFMAKPFAPWVKKYLEPIFRYGLAELEACTRCGKCEQVCPYGLPVMDLLERVKEDHVAALAAIRDTGWSVEHEDAESPFPPAVMDWIVRGNVGQASDADRVHRATAGRPDRVHPADRVHPRE